MGVLAALALVVENRLTAAAQRLGRQLDIGLRQRLLERIPKTKPQYFMSRLSADLTARVHSIYRLRAVPGIGRQILQIGAQIGLTCLALVWLMPQATALILGLVLAAFAIPIALHSLQSEHDLAARTHAGALSRFYLASLRGLTAVRAHGAEQALQREHESLLTRWGRVSQRLLRLNLLGFILQAGLCTALAVGIVLMAIQSLRWYLCDAVDDLLGPANSAPSPSVWRPIAATARPEEHCPARIRTADCAAVIRAQGRHE